MRYSTRSFGSFTVGPTAFAPSTMIPGSGQFDADDSPTYAKVTAIRTADAYVAPLKTSGFKPTAAALALPHIARSPFTGKVPDDSAMVPRDQPIADATGIEEAGIAVDEAREAGLTPDLVFEGNGATGDTGFHYSPEPGDPGYFDPGASRRAAPAATTSSWNVWPWVLGGGVALVAVLALTAARRG